MPRKVPQMPNRHQMKKTQNEISKELRENAKIVHFATKSVGEVLKLAEEEKKLSDLNSFDHQRMFFWSFQFAFKSLSAFQMLDLNSQVVKYFS